MSPEPFPLSPNLEELHTLVVIAASMAIFSSISVLAIILAFASFKEVRTHSNTLVILAALANLAANTATLISTWRLGSPTGRACQAQGFMLQL